MANQVTNTGSVNQNLERYINNLLDEVSVDNFTIKVVNKSKLSMTLILMKMAIDSIPRLNKVFEYNKQIEDQLFDPANIANLTADEKINMYKLSVERQAQSIQFITGILNGIKWHELENVLNLLSTSSSVEEVSIDDQKNAKEILDRLHSLQGLTKSNILEPEVLDVKSSEEDNNA